MKTDRIRTASQPDGILAAASLGGLHQPCRLGDGLRSPSCTRSRSGRRGKKKTRGKTKGVREEAWARAGRAGGARVSPMRSQGRACIYPHWGRVFPHLAKMGRWDGELLESDFCDFAKKRRMGSRDGELLELL